MIEEVTCINGSGSNSDDSSSSGSNISINSSRSIYKYIIGI